MPIEGIIQPEVIQIEPGLRLRRLTYKIQHEWEL